MKHTWPIYLSFLAAMQTNFINWTCWGTCYSRHKYVCVYSMCVCVCVCVYYMFWLWPHSLSAMWQFSRYLASSRSLSLSPSLSLSHSLFIYVFPCALFFLFICALFCLVLDDYFPFLFLLLFSILLLLLLLSVARVHSWWKIFQRLI